MEADEFLLKFQGVLLSFSTSELLNNPTDNYQAEGARKSDIEALSNYVAKLPSTARSRITYYMVLNTEMRVSDDLRNDEFVGLFVNLSPPLLPQALIKWIDILDLFGELCKVIGNSPPFLGEEIISAIIENPKFLSNTDLCLELWSSVFKMICRSENKNQLGTSHIDYFKIVCQKVEECLDLRKVSYENVCALKDFLTKVLHLVSFYKNPDPIGEMYKLSIESKMATSDEILKENFINFIFKTICNILENLDFDAWNSFSNNLQEWKTVRNLFSRIMEEAVLLNLCPEFLDVASKLAVKEGDEAIELLILDAKNGIKCNWTRGVINPEDIGCSDSPLGKMSSDDLDVLLHKAFELLETSGEEMKELFLAGVNVSTSQGHWLELVFEKFKPDLLSTSNTNKDLIEIFNRISNMESIPLDVIIPLCMQSPVQTIKKLCSLAISTRSTDVDVFHKLKPACRVILPGCIALLDHVILCLLSEDMTTTEEDSFTHFVIELKKGDLLSCTFFQNLIKTLKELLDKNEINKSVLCLSLMNSLLDDFLEVNKVAFLVFMSQVLGYFSWDLVSFSPVKANGKDVACSIVDKLMAKLDCNMDSDVLSRAREEILKSWEVNQACFCDLWFTFGKTWHGSGRFDSLILALVHSSSCREDIRMFLMNFGPPDKIKTSIVLALVKILPVLLLKLWKKALTELTEVWEEMNPTVSSADVEVFQMFVTVWYLLTVQLNRDTNIQGCYSHCLAGFGRLFLSARLEGEFLLRTYEQILFILKAIENEEFRKNCVAILLPVLKDRLSSAKGEREDRFDRIRKILAEELDKDLRIS